MGAATVIAAAAVSRLPLDPTMVVPHHDVVAGDVVHEALRGFHTLRTEADLRLLVIVLAISPVLVGANDVLFVAVADGLFDESSSAWRRRVGGSVRPWRGARRGGIGRPRRPLEARVPLAAAIATSGAAIALMGTMSHVAPVCALFMVSGAGLSVAHIAGASLLQRVTPGAVLSRVFGVAEGLRNGRTGLGAAAVSVLVNWLGLRAGLIVLGLAVPAVLATRASRLLRIDAGASLPPPALVGLVAANPIFANLPPPALEAPDID